MPYLVVRDVDGEMRVVPLRGPSLVVGRDPAADITVRGTFASRRHADVAVLQGAVRITDLGSKNGTLLNGVRLAPSGLLRPGDQVVIGGASITYMDDDDGQLTRTLPRAAARVEVDCDRREVLLGGHPMKIALSRQEFNLLAHLYRNANRVCPKEAIGAAIWGEPARGYAAFDQNMIHQLVRRLRAKLLQRPDVRMTVAAVPGVGYRLDIAGELLSPDPTP